MRKKSLFTILAVLAIAVGVFAYRSRTNCSKSSECPASGCIQEKKNTSNMMLLEGLGGSLLLSYNE